MALFPFFVNIEGAKGLVIGTGTHAREKVERLQPYGPDLLVRENFLESDLEQDLAFVIVAGHDREENHRIAKLCRERRILVNVVDDQEYCDFVFPSLIARGNLSIGICTGGASPSAGVLLKRRMEAQIPERMEEILDFLQTVRPRIQEAMPDKKKRFAFYYELSELCMAQNRPLTVSEFENLLAAQDYLTKKQQS